MVKTDNLTRLKIRTKEENEELLEDLLESAKKAILARRYPWGNWPTTGDCDCGEHVEYALEPQYLDLQYRIAMDLYNKMGAEGETQHIENGINRTYESSWISRQLLSEVTPFAGIVK